MVADYFPPEKRSVANSVLTGANFIGIALSSISIILIKNLGWRASYMIMGGMGIISGIIGLALIKNPVRGRYDVPITPEE